MYLGDLEMPQFNALSEQASLVFSIKVWFKVTNHPTYLGLCRVSCMAPSSTTY